MIKPLRAYPVHLLLVLATYAMVKKLFGARLALYTGLYVAVSPFHVVFSLNGMGLIHAATFGPLMVFLLLVGFRSGGGVYFALAGAVLGLSQIFAYIARFLPVLAGLSFAPIALQYRQRLSDGTA